jgi:hypothetical protein
MEPVRAWIATEEPIASKGSKYSQRLNSHLTPIDHRTILLFCKGGWGESDGMSVTEHQPLVEGQPFGPEVLVLAAPKR